MWSTVDPANFRDNWHLGAIAEHLEAVTAGQIQRLIINVPPRHSKSTMVAVMWPAWTWVKNRETDGPLAGPETQFLSASYAHNLAVRDSRNSRQVIASPKYRRRWGSRFALTSDQNTKSRYENDRGGYRLATSVGGALTGEGGDIILVDDPLNSVDAESEIERENCLTWWDQAMSTRLNDMSVGAYVIIMQRLHHQDLTGHLLDQGGWVHVCLPAKYEPDHDHRYDRDPRTQDGELLWEARFPQRAIDHLENTMGAYGAAGQLQQRPAPRTGGMFDRKKWKIVERHEVPEGGQTVSGWDLASSTRKKSPYTVRVRMRKVGADYYVTDVIRFRDTPRGVEQTLRSTTEADGHGVTQDLPQDPGQSGKSQVEHLVRLLAPYPVVYSPESGGKPERASGFAAQQGGGNVYLVRAPWNAAYIEEAALFPQSDYMDQVDASSRAFHRLTPSGPTRGVSLPIVGEVL